MSGPNRIAKDLHKHFCTRLRRLLEDSSDTCHQADIEYGDIIGLHMSGLLSEIVLACEELQLTDEQFSTIMQTAWGLGKKERASASKVRRRKMQ